MSLNKVLLFKVLNLTFNENDQACLEAIRYVNNMLKEENMDWESFIPEVDLLSIEREKLKTRNIRKMLDSVIKIEKNNEFIDSINYYYSKSGRLSQKQFATLTQIYNSLIDEIKCLN